MSMQGQEDTKLLHGFMRKNEMTTHELCIKLGKILSRHYISKFYYAGILNTVARNNRRTDLDVQAVHKSLKESIEEEKRKSEKTIAMLQEGIDAIEGLPRKISSR